MSDSNKNTEYIETDILYESDNSIVYRCIEKRHHGPVIIKSLNKQNPSDIEIARFQQEYAIARSIESDGTIKVFDLIEFRNRPSIVMEDFGGESLSRQLEKYSLSLEHKLKLAKQLSLYLDFIHRKAIIHLDINPSNIVWNPETDTLKYIDFGISSKSIIDHQDGVLEGTIPYISPEQTGRMNRRVDSRSDIYSMGISLYELFAGEIPFYTEDPLQMIHSHIAKSPAPLSSRDSEIPEAVSTIVMKMLAKEAENRYQSAMGVYQDLEYCIRQIESGIELRTFPIGQYDVTSEFNVPQKIFGREKELTQLLKTLDNTKGGQTELVMVEGYSGTGKTTLVLELSRYIEESNGILLYGKYGQLERSIPYFALDQAFNQYIKKVLLEPQDNVYSFRSKIKNILGDTISIIIEALPSLKSLIGGHTKKGGIDHRESENRLHHAIGRFLNVIATQNNPVTLFLDDLQWADSPSLRLIEHIIGNCTDGIMIVCAYRNNELNENQTLKESLDRIIKRASNTRVIELGVLHASTINEIIAETTGRSVEETKELARLCLMKTKGNPFYLQQALKALYSNRLIVFNHEKQSWVWDLEKIKASYLKETLSDILLEPFAGISDGVATVGKLAACVGNSFDLNTMDIVTGKRVQAIEALDVLVRKGFLQSTSRHKYLYSNQRLNVEYRFTHDRIRQTIYEYLTSEERKLTHLKLGLKLLEAYKETPSNARLFDVVKHLNRAGSLAEKKIDFYDIAQLNLIAGIEAKNRAAWKSAFDYFLCGIDRLPRDSWETNHKMTFDLLVGAADVAWLIGEHQYSIDKANWALRNTSEQLDRIKVYAVIINSYISQGCHTDAIAVGLSALNELGVKITKEPNKIDLLFNILTTWVKFNCSRRADLHKKKRIKDKARNAEAQILMMIASSAFICGSKIFVLIVSRLVKNLIQYGYFPEAAYGCAAFGVVLRAIFSDYTTSNELAQIALKIVDRDDAKSIKPKIVYITSAGIFVWIKHYKELLARLKENYRLGKEVGDLEYSAFCCHAFCYCNYFMGVNLNAVSKMMVKFSKDIQRQESVNNYFKSYFQTVMNLRGTPTDPCKLTGEIMNEENLVDYFKETANDIGLFEIYANKLYLYYLFHRYEDALELKSRLDLLIPEALSKPNVPIVHFYLGLTLAANANNVLSKKNRKKYLKELKRKIKKFGLWKNQVRSVYDNKWHLLRAEYAKCTGQKDKAEDYYNQAISSSMGNGFLQELALSYELQAKFYLESGKTQAYRKSINLAYDTYHKWGAASKCLAIEKNNKIPLKKIRRLSGQNDQTKSIQTSTIFDSTSRGSNSAIDLWSVMKASQAISSEINIDRLFCRLMEIVIENAGAERGLLFLAEGGEFVIKANYGYSTKSDYPKEAINYVINTQDALIIPSQDTDQRIINKHAEKRGIKSAICVPLIRNEGLLGLLYLENNQVAGAFNQKQLTVLGIIASQATISIENAQYVQKKRELDELRLEKETAEAANKAKSDLLAIVSHDIRTPINTILGFSELLKDNVQKDSLMNEYIGNIRSSGAHLLSLINEILDLAKIESGRLKLQITHVNLSSLFNDVVVQFEDRIREKGIKFELINDEKITGINVEADETRLKQVLNNIIENAYKYTDAGYISIQTHLDIINDELIDLSVIVRDSGPGIKDTKKIFNEFVQEQPEEGRALEGAGLGLSIVKKLVKLMGGEIRIKSEKGAGTAFEIRFSDMKVVKKVEKGAGIAFEYAIHVKFKGQRILVADDNEKNIKLISEYTKSHGLKILTASNGKEAIDRMKKYHVALVLMDIKMPVLNGIEATRILKTGEKKDTPIIAITADITEKTRLAAVECGFNSILYKPVSKTELLNELKKWLHYTNVSPKIDCDRDKRADLLGELILLQEDELNKISKTMIISNIARFAKKVEKIGCDYRCGYLEGWGRALGSNAKSFNKKNIQEMLSYYPDLIRSIEYDK